MVYVNQTFYGEMFKKKLKQTDTKKCMLGFENYLKEVIKIKEEENFG